MYRKIVVLFRLNDGIKIECVIISNVLKQRKYFTVKVTRRIFKVFTVKN